MANAEAEDVADCFQARDEANELVVVEQLKTPVRENSLGGLEFAGAGVAYRLVDGSAVERVDDSHFRIVCSGKFIRRIEGNHGITHHPEHQTSATTSGKESKL